MWKSLGFYAHDKGFHDCVLIFYKYPDQHLSVGELKVEERKADLSIYFALDQLLNCALTVL